MALHFFLRSECLLNETDDSWERRRRRTLGAGAALAQPADRRDAADDLVALHLFDEEPEVVDEFQRGVAAVLFAVRVIDGVEQRNRADARARRVLADHLVRRGVPIRGG